MTTYKELVLETVPTKLHDKAMLAGYDYAELMEYTLSKQRKLQQERDEAYEKYAELEEQVARSNPLAHLMKPTVKGEMCYNIEMRSQILSVRWEPDSYMTRLNIPESAVYEAYKGLPNEFNLYRETLKKQLLKAAAEETERAYDVAINDLACQLMNTRT